MTVYWQMMKKTEKDTNLSFAKKMDTTFTIVEKKQREQKRAQVETEKAQI